MVPPGAIFILADVKSVTLVDQMPDPSNPLSSKAFLSHSTLDKTFVRAVAKRLGRQQVQLDEWFIETGEKFTKALPAALEKSEIFVLFASKASLNSTWVKFESRYAKKLVASEVIRRALVFLIDDQVSPSQLPGWMRKGLIKHVASANSAARIIQQSLNESRGLAQDQLFIGRNDLMNSLSEKLIPTTGMLPPHTLILSGLTGVGRRTLLLHALEDFLSVRLGPVFHLKRNDGLDTLNIALLRELSEITNRAEMLNAISAFRSKSSDERVESLALLLHRIGQDNVASCILDEGALLESNSSYKSEARSLFEKLKAYPETIVAIIHTGAPAVTPNDLANFEACYQKVRPLDKTASEKLLSQRLTKAKIEFSSAEVSELTEYLEGYPPAINLAVQLTADYGIKAIIADKRVLVSFQSQTFVDVLAKLSLEDADWDILKIFASGLELPLEGLAAGVEVDPSDFLSSLRKLIDLNLVLVSGDVYSIAYPVRYAVQAMKGNLTADDYTRIGRKLKQAFWQNNELPEYSIIDSTISAALRGTSDPELASFYELALPSSIFRAARDSFYGRGRANGERALVLLRKLLEVEPDHRDGMKLLLKLQVRFGQYPEARGTLRRIKELGRPEALPLEGYLHWKEGRFKEAIASYQAAIADGQRAVEIYHGLANCLFLEKRIDEAKKQIREGLQRRSRRNGLLVDLAAKIAIATRDYKEAATYVEQLRQLNALEDYNHRAATLYSAIGQPAKALYFAREAVKSPNSRFETEAVLIKVLVDLDELVEAEDRLEQFEKHETAAGGRRDVRLGLRCKLLLRQGDWRAAEAIWQQLADKDGLIQQSLHKDILVEKLKDPEVRGKERQYATAELEQLTIRQTEDQFDLLFETEEDSSDDDLNPEAD